MEGYNTHGEATRDFLYDSATNLFYQFDVDFQAKKAANGRQIVLSKIDPTNGKTTKVNVTGGARDYVTGFCIEKSSKKSVLISSKSEDGNVARAAKKKKKQMENDINNLKNEIGEIKNLLKILVDKNGT